MTERRPISGPPLAHTLAGSGRPVVLVHGLAGSQRVWQRNIATLASSFTVCTVDLPGFMTTRGRGLSLKDIGCRLVALLDSLAIDTCSLVGHSLGGVVCANVAAEHRRRVDRLVLVDSAELALEPGVVRGAVGLAQAIRYTPPNFYPELVRGAVRAGPTTIARAIQELFASDGSDRLARISCPTLLIWGKNDTICPVAIGERASAEIRESRLVLIEGAGHNPMWDRPAAFNDALLGFLRGSSHFGPRAEPTI